MSHLIYEANGVLVLLKFLNQEFSKITVDKDLISIAVRSLLKLTYVTSKNQKQRITTNLVKYKGTGIMKKLYGKFTDSKTQDYIAKIIRMQIRYLERNWRKAHMSIVSIPYQLTQKPTDDDWLQYENTQEDLDMQKT